MNNPLMANLIIPKKEEAKKPDAKKPDQKKPAQKKADAKPQYKVPQWFDDATKKVKENQARAAQNQPQQAFPGPTTPAAANPLTGTVNNPDPGLMNLSGQIQPNSQSPQVVEQSLTPLGNQPQQRSQKTNQDIIDEANQNADQAVGQGQYPSASQDAAKQYEEFKKTLEAAHKAHQNVLSIEPPNPRHTRLSEANLIATILGTALDPTHRMGGAYLNALNQASDKKDQAEYQYLMNKFGNERDKASLEAAFADQNATAEGKRASDLQGLASDAAAQDEKDRARLQQYFLKRGYDNVDNFKKDQAGFWSAAAKASGADQRGAIGEVARRHFKDNEDLASLAGLPYGPEADQAMQARIDSLKKPTPQEIVASQKADTASMLAQNKIEAQKKASELADARIKTLQSQWHLNDERAKKLGVDMKATLTKLKFLPQEISMKIAEGQARISHYGAMTTKELRNLPSKEIKDVNDSLIKTASSIDHQLSDYQREISAKKKNVLDLTQSSLLADDKTKQWINEQVAILNKQINSLYDDKYNPMLEERKKFTQGLIDLNKKNVPNYQAQAPLVKKTTQ